MRCRCLPAAAFTHVTGPASRSLGATPASIRLWTVPCAELLALSEVSLLSTLHSPTLRLPRHSNCCQKIENTRFLQLLLWSVMSSIPSLVRWLVRCLPEKLLTRITLPLQTIFPTMADYKVPAYLADIWPSVSTDQFSTLIKFTMYHIYCLHCFLHISPYAGIKLS